MPVSKEHMIKRQGKDYVLYTGLLTMAHEKFKSMEIHTELLADTVQPTVTCSFTGITKDDETIQTSGIGTAGRPGDTKGAAFEAPIEMAETRAKARALRDAVNVGETAVEELSDSSATTSSQQPSNGSSGAKRRKNPPRSQPAEPPSEEEETGELATAQDLNNLRALIQLDARERGVPYKQIVEAFLDHIEKGMAELTRAEARDWIGRYEKKLSADEDEGEDE